MTVSTGNIHPDKRLRIANRICAHLAYKPEFFFKRLSNRHLWLRYTTHRGVREEPVTIMQDTDFFRNHRKHPWGGNQGRALSIFAQWIRGGEMLALDAWERWCGPPVELGNKTFLEEIQKAYKEFPA